MLGAGSFAYFTYKHYDNRIRRIDALQTSDPHIVQRAKQLHAQNFLMIGSDTRAGADAKYEATAGQVGARDPTPRSSRISRRAAARQSW